MPDSNVFGGSLYVDGNAHIGVRRNNANSELKLEVTSFLPDENPDESPVVGITTPNAVDFLTLSCGNQSEQIAQLAWNRGSVAFGINTGFDRTTFSEHLRITETGHLGIGTQDPREKLHVEGALRGNQNGALRISTGSGYVDVGPQGPDSADFLTDRSRYYFDKELRIDSGMIGSHDEDLQLCTSGNKRLTIDNDTGNVGVGVSPAQEKLHLDGSVRGNQNGALRINTGSGYVDIGPQDMTYSHFKTNRTKFYFNREVVIDAERIGSVDQDIKLHTAGSTRMILQKATGFVGIGPSSPEAKLHVQYKSQNANGDTLIIGNKNASNLRLGYHTSYSWIQSHGGNPLAINPLGSNVGIGTSNPKHNLSIQAKRPQLLLTDNQGDAGVLEFYEPGKELRIQYWDNFGASYRRTMMALKTETGNVGIGTTDPGNYKLSIGETGGKNVLHLASDFGLLGDDKLNLIKFGNDGDYQMLHKSSGVLGRNTLALHVHRNDAFGIYSSGWSSLMELSGGSGNMYLKGNLGIGTSDPKQHLSIQAARPRLVLTDNKGDGGVLEFYEPGKELRLQYWNDFGASYRRTIMALKTDTGRVGIGTTNPKADLDVPGGAILNGVAIGVDPPGAIKFPYPYETVGTVNTGHNLRLHSYNNIFFHVANSQAAQRGVARNGNWYGSTKEIKERIRRFSLKEALKILNGLNPTKFVYKADEEKKVHAGFIAEDVPEMIASPDRKMISEMDIIAVLTKVVKRQLKDMAALKRQVEKLQGSV